MTTNFGQYGMTPERRAKLDSVLEDDRCMGSVWDSLNVGQKDRLRLALYSMLKAGTSEETASEWIHAVSDPFINWQ